MTRVWYDKSATDDRVWCVKSADGTVQRAARVVFAGASWTEFNAEGHMELQPGGPRGVIVTEDTVGSFDTIPV